LGTRGRVEPARLVTQLEGRVLTNGDVEVAATTELGPREGAIFFAFSVHGRALPLGEAVIKQGRAQAVVEGIAPFLRLAPGPLPPSSLAARLDDWPDDCKLGQLVVDAGGGASPTLETPTVREQFLEITAYFEDPALAGGWELLLAASPNSWQMLAKFDIKCLVERPQVLKAKMPGTVEEGPFGGALWLRRQ